MKCTIHDVMNRIQAIKAKRNKRKLRNKKIGKHHENTHKNTENTIENRKTRITDSQHKIGIKFLKILKSSRYGWSALIRRHYSKWM
ncbi:unnamed protein product [Callosobruchus maculatus]|uniref:Uncharacterized protein n=1 Tax=Callosobruchus maculatus TaxID=64391 RepID=A0A653DHK3_CALMS|nr:unnamed protein product [Callosobruchus maculatus]